MITNFHSSPNRTQVSKVKDEGKICKNINNTDEEKTNKHKKEKKKQALEIEVIKEIPNQKKYEQKIYICIGR